MAEEVKNEEVAQEPVQLSLQDIATCVQVVDLCSKRGAFEGPELETVGGLRNRLVQFVEANQPKDEPVEGNVPEVESEPVAEEADS